MSGGTRWHAAMRVALGEAVRAGGAGDVPIGAVVLDPAGEVVASAGNEREQSGDPTAHAEILALRRAVDALRGGTARVAGTGGDSGASGAAGASHAAEASGAAGASLAAAEGWRLEDCTLVVTLEPCTMCAGAVVNARIARLVFGAFDPKAGAVSSLRDVVRDLRLNHRVEVTSGVLADECGAVLREFFASRR